MIANPHGLSEYEEIIREIARGPRRTLWQRFTIWLACRH